MNSFVIKVESLSKQYFIGKQQTVYLRSALRNLFSKQQRLEEFWALKDVTFSVEEGEIFGIVGKNGAGKSTLLKILSKITYPTTGKAIINGRVGSLLEVGTGFHPELTGRENIYLNGSLLGMNRSEIKSRFNDILAFSELEKFVDTPVKHFSTGMYVRLAFAVAVHLEPEVLIIDEVLSVGDIAFQEKCLNKIEEIKNNGTTILMVSHNMDLVKRFCSTGLLLSQGKVIRSGSIDQVVNEYYNTLQLGQTKKKVDFDIIELREIVFQENLSYGEDLTFDVILDLNTNYEKNLFIDILISSTNGEPVFHLRTPYVNKHGFQLKQGLNTLRHTIKQPNIRPQHYELVIYIYDEEENVHLWLENVGNFSISENTDSWHHSSFEGLVTNHIPQFTVNLL